MRQVKPEYYDKFQCIADKCSISCCQEWKIAVDDMTNEKWRETLPPDTVKKGKKSLAAYTARKDGERVIRLNEEGKCPFLDEQKLCKLVRGYGDQMLSKTCQTFPREIHKYETRTEYALLTCCPEVVDYLYQMPKFGVFQEKGKEQERDMEQGKDVEVPAEEKKEELLFEIRDFLCELAQQEENTAEKNLLMIFYILKDMAEKTEMTEEMLQDYKQKSMLSELSNAIDKMEFHAEDTFVERNELLLDLAENYRKEGLYQAYLKEITEYAEALAEDYDAEGLLEKQENFAAVFAEFTPLMKRFAAEQIYEGCLMPEGDLESMVVQLQWIAMEYAAVCHAIRLYWMKNESLTYETVRDYMVVISRMTGYDEEDIYEYLENSFEELIWDWGYFALVIGKIEEYDSDDKPVDKYAKRV